MKVWKQTLANLKVLAALRRKTMLRALDELVTEALEKEQKERTSSVSTANS